MPVLEDELATLVAVTQRLVAERSERLAQEIDPDAPAVAALRHSRTLAELAELASGPDERPTELARRAYRQAVEAAATRLRLDPGPELVARLGPLPPAGPTRDSWEEAVEAIAAYRSHWQAFPLPQDGGVAWAIGQRPAGGPAAADYRRVEAVLQRAEAQLAATRPTPELAHEHRQLARALAAAPGPAQHQDALSAAHVAHERLAQARRAEEHGRERVAALEGSRRRNRQGLEMARRLLAQAEHNAAAAALVAQRADERAAAVGADVDAQAPARARLSVLAQALDAQVASAVSHPAGYLQEALGARQSEGAAQRWDRAAERLESYRHREMGLSPADGPLPHDDALERAIGPRPGEDPLGALAWDHAAESLDPDAELSLRPEPPELALDL